MYFNKPMLYHVSYRSKKRLKLEMIAKIRLMKNLKAFVGFGRCTYMDLCLKELEIAKELFVLELIQGDETIIPGPLMQKDLPQSF